MGRDAIGVLGGYYRVFLENVANQISSPGGNVVVGYPELVEEPNFWTGMSQVTRLCAGLNAMSPRRIRGWAAMLNALIGQAVSDANPVAHLRNVRIPS
jgi:hypothetical protein